MIHSLQFSGICNKHLLQNKKAGILRDAGFFLPYFQGMQKDSRLLLKSHFGEEPITRQALQEFEAEHGVECSEDWFEQDDSDSTVLYLTSEILEWSNKSKEKHEEALGLGDLEERIVDVLEHGKTIKWGKLALAMWLFFLFIVVYTVIETVFQQ